MSDILRDTFPGLVPITGSSDGGWDGAVANGKAETFPLLTTIGDLRSNLSKNLNSLAKEPRGPRKIILATSRRVTPLNRQKLKDFATERGFSLVQVFDQEAVADRLYFDAGWCKRLLGIAGTPSPLTHVPASHRPSLEIDLLGREADVEWLTSTSGDRVLAGQPGSGKSYLLQTLIRRRWDALFLARADEAAIAEAIRRQRPSVVIVDDAHADSEPTRIATLARLREIADFSIVATTWEGRRDQVANSLGRVSEARVRKLEPLARTQILEIFKRVGVMASDEFLRVMVDQAGNRPGLAVTIATLWLQGLWRDVLEGKALSRELLIRFRELLGRDVEVVLAAFSLGGEGGMRMEDMADWMHMSLPDLWQVTTELAMGGVLSELGGSALAVRPRQLRSALIQAVFFPQAAPKLDYRPLLERSPLPDRAVLALVDAYALGAAVPAEELRSLIVRSGSRHAWESLAWTREDDALWVLENYAGDVVDVMRGALERAPREAVRRIFGRADEAVRSGQGQPDQAMNLLREWVQDRAAGAQEGIRRRRLVAQASREFLLAGGHRGLGAQGIAIALSPSMKGSSIDPALGDTLTLRFSLLPRESLPQIREIWDDVLPSLLETVGVREIDRASFQDLHSTLRNWIQPEHAAMGAAISEDTRAAMRDVAAQMLLDLRPLAAGRPAVAAELKRLAARIGVELEMPRDPVFELLYPEADASFEARQLREDSQQAAFKDLAADWARRPPPEVATLVSFYQREAETIGHGWIPTLPELCRALAAAVDEPESWLEAFLEHDPRGTLAAPFLERIVTSGRTGWERQVARCLDLRSLAWTATALMFQHPSPPPALLDRAIERAEGFPSLVDTLCLRREVPLPTLRLLLRLPRWETAFTAAVGEWASEPQGKVRQEVIDDWRTAVLNAKTADYEDAPDARENQYWLGVILAKDGDLALEWLRARLLDDDKPLYFMDDSPFARAVTALERPGKLRLLRELDPHPIARSLVPRLIGGDLVLYETLLADDRLSDLHLEPLRARPEGDWIALAEAALSRGYDPRAVAGASLSSSHLHSGSGLEYWIGWDEAFAALEKHDNSGLGEVGQAGREMASGAIAQARQRQTHFELRGFHG
ncbi:MAG TPA: hypothetical protein VHR45_15930 [Thermoanaerobaculia bacterium]|nr:hypothetical protein [Thermoanaerobaculia bacterium]